MKIQQKLKIENSTKIEKWTKVENWKTEKLEIGGEKKSKIDKIEKKKSTTFWKLGRIKNWTKMNFWTKIRFFRIVCTIYTSEAWEKSV